MNKINIIALAALGGGLSGGDRIFIEFARNWSKDVRVDVYVWEEGLAMCRRENLEGEKLKINLIKVGKLSKLGFIFTYFYRVLLGLKLGFSLRVKPGEYFYSASEFWMDTLPAVILKLRNPKAIWVAAWYQTAPNPLIGFAEGDREKRYKLSAFFYWFIQKTTKPLISAFADFVLVNNDNEKRQFSLKNKQGKVIPVLGAIKTEGIDDYKKLHPEIPKKKYLAVFQGRFHPQKGVVELIDIWKLVTAKFPEAKLAMIGDGPLKSEVEKRIRMLGLEKNVDLLGYLHDGDRKYSIFNDSKIVVHPSFYDSGGMASAEAMAFGLPVVGFNLKSYGLYYPKGMVKVPVSDYNAFAKAILELADNNSMYNKFSQESKDMIDKTWSWNYRASEILSKISPS